MPGRSLEPSMDAVIAPKFGSLKSHKTLPRRKHVVVDSNHMRLPEQQSTRDRSDQDPYASAERIQSWIPEPSSIRVIPVIGVPLTPPINFRDDFQSWIDDAALRKRGLVEVEASGSAGSTPLVQQSPPTPEATPPKKIHRTQAVASFISSRTATDSRTESFKTAQENQSSDDESQDLDSPSLHPSRQQWLKIVGLSKHKDVGLGLGLESDNEGLTPRATTPRLLSQPQDFTTFDGSWYDNMQIRRDNEVLEDPVKPKLYERTRRRTRMVSEPTLDSPTLGKAPEGTPKKSLSLRQRVDQKRHSPRNASTEKFAEQIEWPLKDGDYDVGTDHREINDKRLSQASTTSTVVEAMVIKSPPRRRQTLRRTGKMTDLVSTSQQPNRDSLVSNGLPPRRLRRSGSPDQELRKSFASDTPISVVSSVEKIRHENAPVVPDRRSSLQSSTSGSKRLSRTFSFTSRQQSSRPTTAPEENVGYFDIPRPRDRRTMSVVIHAPTPLHAESNLKNERSAPASAEASPPSVPTSSTEAPSKTTSITSMGLDHFHASATSNVQQNPTLHLTDPQDAQYLSLDPSGTGEWSAIRPRSTMVTPFSLRSAQSSTPGTLEVNEATAISIYPHTNRSILVIQQMAGGSDSSPRERSAIIAGNANIALPGSLLAPVVQHISPPEPSRDVLNSPLQNPRDPPQPPDFKIIPPTPANGPPSPDNQRTPSRTLSKTKRFSAPIISLKRAFSSHRPRSESCAAPFTRTFSLRGTAETRRRWPLEGDGPQSKLHPFWRPRDYYDSSDSDSEFGNTGFLNGSRAQTQSSRDAAPARTMSLTRRLSNSIRLPHPARKQRPSSMVLPTGHDHSKLRRHFAYGDAADHDNQASSQGRQAPSVGFRGLANRFGQRREAKEEDKREERRQWLRGRIGPVEHGSVKRGLVGMYGRGGLNET